MIYDQYRHRASPEPLRIIEDSTSHLVRHAIHVLAEQEKAERRSRPRHELSWSEQQEERASAGVVEKTGRELLAERIGSQQERRNRPPQVEEVPPPGPALAAAIVRAGAKARGEIS
jgi:hypothetical protein